MKESYETLKINLKDSGILQITLNRPQRLNALNAEMLGELHSITTEAKSDTAVKALLFTGSEKAFCAGADITELAELTSHQGVTFARRCQRIFRDLEQLGKPSLAAISGYAFGGGCELAMATTLRIASSTALFAQPEIKLGIIPGYGGTQRLARLVGKGRALDLCITGRCINAEDAKAWGLISEVVPPEKLLARADEILHTILGMAPLAIASVLKVIDAGYDLPLDDALHLEAVHFGLLCDTKDKVEGVAAFLEKRPPNFTGT